MDWHVIKQVFEVVEGMVLEPNRASKGYVGVQFLLCILSNDLSLKSSVNSNLIKLTLLKWSREVLQRVWERIAD